MLGFGAISEYAVGEAAATFALTSDILQHVITRLVEQGRLSSPPALLYHYT
jgi:hypothetical protein